MKKLIVGGTNLTDTDPDYGVLFPIPTNDPGTDYYYFLDADVEVTGDLTVNELMTVGDVLAGGDLVGDNLYVTGAVTAATGTFSGSVTAANLSGTNTGDQNLFSTFAVVGQSNVVADAVSDTVTFAAGANIAITTNAGTDTITFAVTGVGDVVGPSSVTDNRLARFNGTTGKLIQESLADLDDSGNLTTPGFVYAGVNGLGMDAGSYLVNLLGNPAATGDLELTFPPDQGTGQLTNDGAGNLTWETGGGSGAATLPITQPGHGFAVLEGVRYDEATEEWVWAMSDDGETLADGVVVAVDGDDFEVAQGGPFAITHGLLEAEFYYLSDTVPGELTATEPSPISQLLVKTLDPDHLFVLPYRPMPTSGGGGGGSGDVEGPGSATDNAIARYDGITGKLIQDSLVTIDDTGNVTSPATFYGLSFAAQDTVTANIVAFSTGGAALAVVQASGAGMVLSAINTSTFAAMPISLNAKTVVEGSGNLWLKDQAQLRYYDADSSHYMGFKAPSSVTTSWMATWPATPGSAGQVLSTDGHATAPTLSWTNNGGAKPFIRLVDGTSYGSDGNYVVLFATVNDNVGSGFVHDSHSGRGSRIQVPSTGIYRASATFYKNGTWAIQANLMLFGGSWAPTSNSLGTNCFASSAGQDNKVMNISGEIYLTAGDYIWIVMLIGVYTSAGAPGWGQLAISGPY